MPSVRPITLIELAAGGTGAAGVIAGAAGEAAGEAAGGSAAAAGG
jgi:hypothetical protein